MHPKTPSLQLTVDPSWHLIVVGPPTIGGSQREPAPGIDICPWSTQTNPGSQSGNGPPVDSSKPSQTSPIPASNLLIGPIPISGCCKQRSSLQSFVPAEHSITEPSGHVIVVSPPTSSLQYSGEPSKQSSSISGQSTVYPLGHEIL